MTALLTDKAGLTLAVGFLAVAADTTRSGCVGRVYCVERDTRKGGLIGEEETKLPEGPRGMLRSLGFPNRAFRAFTDVP